MSLEKKLPLKRHVIALKEKIEILDKLKEGVKISTLAKSLNLHEATIRTIKKNEEKIRENVLAGCSTTSKRMDCARDINVVKMEEALAIWIQDCNDKRIPLDGLTIRQKALNIYKYLKEMASSSAQEQQQKSFCASKGWLEKFKTRYSLRSLKLQGESASADAEAAGFFTLELQKIVEDGEYTADQIFNVDETAFYWKKMPSRTYISKSQKSVPGFKVDKQRLTLLMCTNASGNFMLKPMVINRSFNPRPLKNIDKSKLSVHWRANKKAWMTANIFKEWFENCFILEVENYMIEKNLSFKILLLLDNATSHPKDLYHPNVKVVFLPPNTTSLLQPLDQGIIATFKAHFIRKSFETILQKIESDESKTLLQAWKEFSILDCVTKISSAISEIKPSTINGSWKPVLPQIVQKENSDSSGETLRNQILNIAHKIGGEGFDNLNSQDLDELFQEPTLTEAELIEIINEPYEDTIVNEDAENYPEDSSPNISVTDVQQGLDLAKKLELHFMEIDPSLSRKRTFQQNLKTCLGPYLKFLNTTENKRVPSSNISYENVSSDEEFLPPRRKRIRILDDDSDQEISIDKDPLPIQGKTNQSLESEVVEHT